MNNNLIEPERLHAEYEDIADVLKIIEKSYAINFEKDELKDVRTFGELCTIIISKIKLEEAEDCTSQQAFYKLRSAILLVNGINPGSIEPDTLLTDIFPKKNRRTLIAAVEANLGLKLNILMPPFNFTLFLFILLIVSLFGLYFKWQYGLTGSVISTLLLILVFKTARNFSLKTVREVAELMTRENYLKVRRNPQKVNRAEVVKQIEKLFIFNLRPDMKEIKPETIL